MFSLWGSRRSEIGGWHYRELNGHEEAHCTYFPRCWFPPGRSLEHQEADETGYFWSLVHLLKGSEVYFWRKNNFWRVTIHFYAFVFALILFTSHQTSLWSVCLDPCLGALIPTILSPVSIFTNFFYPPSIKRQQLSPRLSWFRDSGYRLSPSFAQHHCIHRKYKMLLLMWLSHKWVHSM